MSYQYSRMSEAQIEEFLAAPRFAIVGTNRVNGPPQLTPVWYLYEDGRVYLYMYLKSAKYRNLSRDPRIGLCIAAESPDARAVMIYGTAQLIGEDDKLHQEIEWRLTRRYHDNDAETKAFMDSLPTEDQSALAVITPQKIIAEDYN